MTSGIALVFSSFAFGSFLSQNFFTVLIPNFTVLIPESSRSLSYMLLDSASDFSGALVSFVWLRAIVPTVTNRLFSKSYDRITNSLMDFIIFSPIVNFFDEILFIKECCEPILKVDIVNLCLLRFASPEELQ